jgi:hypothetical protein
MKPHLEQIISLYEIRAELGDELMAANRLLERGVSETGISGISRIIGRKRTCEREIQAISAEISILKRAQTI